MCGDKGDKAVGVKNRASSKDMRGYFFRLFFCEKNTQPCSSDVVESSTMNMVFSFQVFFS